MPLKNYRMLKGRPINNRLATGSSNHYQVLISANGTLFRIAVNVQSVDGSEVQFLVRTPFHHFITGELSSYEEGLHDVPRQPGGIALDFIRMNIMQPWEMKPLPVNAAGPDNDLNDKIDALVQRAMADEEAMLYAFGESWGPEENQADKYFGFRPGRGIHDIHMNQGNPPGRFASQNGEWQDGGLIFEFPRQAEWVAVFLKFQTQAWHSEDAGGDPIYPPDVDHPPLPDPDQIPPFDAPDGLVRIIAALVNSVASPELETVTLLNTADVEIDLTNWSLKDRNKNAMLLSGSIDAGKTRLFKVAEPMQLSNKGGAITLLNKEGIKVHGVSYTKSQARQPGRTIPFQT